MSVKNFYYNGSKRFVLILSLTFFLFLLPAISYANANFYNKSANINAVDYNITANVYHGNIDWVYTIIGMSGNTACDNLDNKVAGYSYTCQTVIDTGGGTVACGTTLVALNAQSACKVD